MIAEVGGGARAPLQMAAVTGASGMIGRRIVRQLLQNGFRVKVLSRLGTFSDPRVEVVKGEILDGHALQYLLRDAQMLFHCAAELIDPLRMHKVNVEGTAILLEKARQSPLEYFCHLSSAGVVGITDRQLVDESVPANPRNDYEKSKLEAEELLKAGIDGCRVVILRPTNVIDDDSPGAFNLALDRCVGNSLKLILKGRECAHVLHAEDVADAALFFVKKNTPAGCYFVSRDDDSINTYADLWRLCLARMQMESFDQIRTPWSLPLSVPFHLRRILRGQTNRGSVRYTSGKLFAAGFEFSMSIDEMADRIVARFNNR